MIGQTKSKELLLKLAVSSSSSSRLQLIGMMCGFEEWAQTFQEKMAPPVDSVEELDAVELDDVIMVDR